MPVRLVQLASITEVYSRTRGIEAARAVVRRNRGGLFDPFIADLFQDRASKLLDALDDDASWDAVIDAEPDLAQHVAGPELDNVLEAMADLVDLKSPFVAGHSRGVANLAAEAGRLSGFSDDKVAVLRRAGLVHDLGRLGVSNAVWDKRRSLTAAESERVRLHPYLGDRMLARVPALAQSREIASRHHERLDGSGYPGGLTGSALSPADRLLAAADVYHALTEPRPYRPAFDADRAAEHLRAEVKANRLDGEAMTAVLRAAGHRAAARRDGPSGLTSREVEVLGLLARGASNKEIAVRLTVSPKTVSNHVEHIYTKIDVSSRAAATLYATQQGLVGSFEAAKMR
jgi:DNA-binding CsgD family transcriptional regulator